MFTVQDFEPDDVEAWPENAPAVELFQRLQTQWRVGVNGRTGLDYAAALAVMARMRLTDAEHDALFADLQVLEGAALDAMHKKD